MLPAAASRQNPDSSQGGARTAGPVCESVTAADRTPGMHGRYTSPFPPASSQLQPQRRSIAADSDMCQVKAMVQTVQALVQLHSPAGDSLRRAAVSMPGAAN